jgi:hypothetical protein
MSETSEFREAKISLGGDWLPYVVEASVVEKWEAISIPVYRDSEAVRTLPTTKRVTAHIRCRYNSDSPLHGSLDGNPLAMEFNAGGDSYNFSNVKVLEWRVSGSLGGEMVEEVALACEEES